MFEQLKNRAREQAPKTCEVGRNVVQVAVDKLEEAVVTIVSMVGVHLPLGKEK